VESLPNKRRILQEREREKEKEKIKRKRKKEQGLKSKRGEISFEKLHVSKGEKKQRRRFINCCERFY
jgi:hypothetical protein